VRVLIAGAGLGGLAAALALLRHGIDVDVYEQATALGEVGAGVQLSPNGTRILAHLGIADAVAARASEAAAKEIRLWSTGQRWPLFDLGARAVERYGSPYWTLYRPDLIQALADGIRREKPGAIHLAARIAGFHQDQRQATLHLEDGRRISADALVGADGIHSRIRATLFGPADATFTGLVAWRGVIPATRLPPHLTASVGVNWVGPGRHVIHYPLRRGELVNFVGIVERHDWTVESWTAQGTQAELAADFPGWHADIHTLIRAIDTPHKWALKLRPPLAAWSQGRVTLLGDACHPTLPMLAQGAVQALEDGLVLARALTQIPSIPAALLSYEATRRDRTARVIQGSAENARRFHDPSLATAAGAAAYVAREWAEPRVEQRYDWLFRYQADTEPLASTPAWQSRHITSAQSDLPTP